MAAWRRKGISVPFILFIFSTKFISQKYLRNKNIVAISSFKFHKQYCFFLNEKCLGFEFESFNMSNIELKAIQTERNIDGVVVLCLILALGLIS